MKLCVSLAPSNATNSSSSGSSSSIMALNGGDGGLELHGTVLPALGTGALEEGNAALLAIQQLHAIGHTLQQWLGAAKAAAAADEPWVISMEAGQALSSITTTATSSSRSSVVVVPVATDAAHSPLQVLLNAHAAARQVPRASQVLLCSSRTSWGEIELLLMRMNTGSAVEQQAGGQIKAGFGAGVEGGLGQVAGGGGSGEMAGGGEGGGRAGGGRVVGGGLSHPLYCLVDVHKLQGAVQLQLLEGLKKMQVKGKETAAAAPAAAEAEATAAADAEMAAAEPAAAADGSLSSEDRGRRRQYTGRQLLVTFSASEPSLLKDGLTAGAAMAAAAPVHIPSSMAAPIAAAALSASGGTGRNFGLIAAGPLLSSLNHHLGRHLLVLTSDQPGQGKSATAARLAATWQQQVKTVAVVDDMGAEQLIEQLHGWDCSRDVLHLNLLSSSSAAGIDTMLLQLLVLGYVLSKAGGTAYHLPHQQYTVVVEVGNTLGDKLFRSLQLAVAAPLGDEAALGGEADARRVPSPAAAAGAGGGGQGVVGATATPPAAAAGAGPGAASSGPPPGCFRMICSFSLDQLQLNTPAARTVCSYLQALDQGWLDREDVLPERHCPSAQACQQLLQRYFIAQQEQQGLPVSYALVRNFIEILGQQLLHFSNSVFFRVDMLAWAHHGHVGTVRSSLVRGMLQASTVQAVESCTAARASQHVNMSSSRGLAGTEDGGAVTAAQLAARGSGIVQWQECNHMLLLFNARDNYQTITALYRLHSQLPDSFRQLLNSQQEAVQDYSRMGQYELYDQLQMLVGRQGGGDFLDGPVYVLTPDNLLKMALIHLRIKSGIPVVMMGDTGCGKTSLLKYLAAASGVQLVVLNVHAGTTPAAVLDALRRAEQLAEAELSDVWLFLDEINTCDHQGLLADLVVHRQWLGRGVDPRVVPIAACNPFRLKPEGRVTAGLPGKVREDDGMSCLVYSVHPLPETLMSYVWDFGCLNPVDERGYVTAMVAEAISIPGAGAAVAGAGAGVAAAAGGDAAPVTAVAPAVANTVAVAAVPFRWYVDQQVVVDLLCLSQQYTRDLEGLPWCVSLRDVKRCLHLVQWFENNLRNRPQPAQSRRARRNAGGGVWTLATAGAWNAVKAFGVAAGLVSSAELGKGSSGGGSGSGAKEVEDVEMRRLGQHRALLLALAHTYMSRMASAERRGEYLARVARLLPAWREGRGGMGIKTPAQLLQVRGGGRCSLKSGAPIRAICYRPLGAYYWLSML